jgi:hypothetical protein
MAQVTIIFVNDRPHRVWIEDSHFRNQDLTSGFDPYYFSYLAEVIRPELNGKSGEKAALGIRTIYGLAVEAFFSMLFATLQAPQAPAAWLLLYRPGDIRALIQRFEACEDLPSKIVPREPGSWEALVSMLLPITESDHWNAPRIVSQLGQFWQSLAKEFLDDVSSAEFNSLKHGLRARPASPFLSIDGHEFTGAANGSAFPIHRCLGSDVLVNIGTRTWSAEQLCAALKLISSSLVNILALLKNLHGEASGPLAFELPSQEEFDAAKPGSEPLKSFRLGSNWSPGLSIPKLDKAEALRIYKETSGPLEAHRTPNLGPQADG